MYTTIKKQNRSLYISYENSEGWRWAAGFMPIYPTRKYPVHHPRYQTPRRYNLAGTLVALDEPFHLNPTPWRERKAGFTATWSLMHYDHSECLFCSLMPGLMSRHILRYPAQYLILCLSLQLLAKVQPIFGDANFQLHWRRT